MSAFPDGPKPANARAARHAHACATALHGTMRRYWAGCSCQLCKAENTRYQNARNDERRRGVLVPRPRRAARDQHARATTLEELLREW